MKCVSGISCVVVMLASVASAQTPRPFPTTPAQAPRPAQPAPAPTTPPAPPPPASQQAAAAAATAAPSAEALGVAVYPDAQFLGSYDAGRGQRYYLYGTTAGFNELLGYYRTQTGERGDLVFKDPPTHMFTGGTLARFREETMAFPPSVTVKDWKIGRAHV